VPAGYVPPAIAMARANAQAAPPRPEDHWKREESVFVGQPLAQDLPPKRSPWTPVLMKLAWLAVAGAILYTAYWIGWGILSGRFDEWLK